MTPEGAPTAPPPDAGPRVGAPRRLRAPRASDLPAAILALLGRLTGEGHAALLVGGCLRDLLRGAAVRDFDVVTSAPAEIVLHLFPRAVPIGLRHGTVMVPTTSGPVDVTTFRAGPRIEDDLAHRDFTVNAIAWDPRTDRIVDPAGGREDLAAGRLRAVGSAEARLAEDPLRALRAARLVATLGLVPDAALERAIAAAVGPLSRVARERVRHELETLLVAPGVADGLALLRRTGIESALVGDAAPDAPAVTAALPPRLALRLAGWLRGLDAGVLLSRLRFPRRLVRQVAGWLRQHPVDRDVDPARDSDVRRLMRRAGEDAMEPLIALREAELAAAPPSPARDVARAHLAALREAEARVRRSGTLALRRLDLALGGREVMEILGWPPGRAVGRVLRALAEVVIEDPASNTPEALRERLLRWKADGALPS